MDKVWVQPSILDEFIVYKCVFEACNILNIYRAPWNAIVAYYNTPLQTRPVIAV